MSNPIRPHVHPKFLPRGQRIVRWALFVGTLLVGFWCALLLVRQFTWACIGSLSDSASRLTVPALIASALALIGVFVDISDYSKQFRAWIAKLIEKTRFPYFAAISAILALLMVYILWASVTPTKWSRFINEDFLGGERDAYHSASVTIDTQIKPIDASTADAMGECLSIFQLRARKNLTDSPDDEASLKSTLLRLEQTTAHDNIVEPLLLYSTAEGYSLLAQMTGNIAYYDTARVQYRRFLDRKDRTITSQWRRSGAQNIGNIYYYEGDYVLAIQTWSNLPENPSTDGNIAAALVQNGDFAQAIVWADKGLTHKEPEFAQLRASLTENKMIALMCQGKAGAAIDLFNSSEFAGRAAAVSIEGTVCLAYLLMGSEPKYKSELKAVDQPKTQEILECIWELRSGNYGRALLHAHNAFLPRSFGDADCLQELVNDLKQRGYFCIPEVHQLIQAAQANLPSSRPTKARNP